MAMPRSIGKNQFSLYRFRLKDETALQSGMLCSPHEPPGPSERRRHPRFKYCTRALKTNPQLGTSFSRPFNCPVLSYLLVQIKPGTPASSLRKLMYVQFNVLLHRRTFEEKDQREQAENDAEDHAELVHVREKHRLAL